jgi:hypothetical protein
LPQRTRDRQRLADAVFARGAAIAILVVTALRADQLAVDTTDHSIGTENGVRLACAVVAVEASFAMLVVAALRADELVIDAASRLPQWADDQVRLTEPVDAGGALAALFGIAAFVAIHAFDRDIGGRPEDAAELIFWTDADACVHADITEFAGVFTEKRRANAVDTPLARIAVFVVAAFLAYAGAAEQACRAIGSASPTIGRVVLQVLAHALAAGLAHWTVGQGWATERRRNTNAVAAFFFGGVATVGAAGKLE